MILDEDDSPPADPAASLLLITQQQAATRQALTPGQHMFFLPWGFAWLVGFGAYVLREPLDLPEFLPLTVLFALLALAGVLSGVAGARAYGSISGDSARRGHWYGLCWFAGFASMTALLVRVGDQMPPETIGLLWSASSVGITGMLQMAGGAIWLDKQLFRLGCYVLAVNIAGVLAGPQWHPMLVAVLGGGGMLIAGTVAWRRERAAR